MQLAMAALGQFAGGGSGLPVAMPGGGFPAGIGVPTAPVLAPRRSRPVLSPAGQTSSLQLASLATVTCLLREGQLSRHQALTMLSRQGDAWGWDSQWGQRIPLSRVDQAIRAAGGCKTMVSRIRETRPTSPYSAVVPASERPRFGGSRSEQEGFGLYPYR